MKSKYPSKHFNEITRLEWKMNTTEKNSGYAHARNGILSINEPP